MKRTICFILVFMFIISAVSVFAVESNDTDVENTIDEETQISEPLLTDERAAQLINALVYIKENLNDKEYKKALTYIGYTEDELNVTGNITDDGYFNTGLNYNDFNTRMSSLFSDSVRKQIIDDLTVDIDGLLGVKVVESYNVPSSFRIINQGQNDNLYSFYIKYLIQNNQEISIIIEIEDIDGTFIISSLYDYKIVEAGIEEIETIPDEEPIEDEAPASEEEEKLGTVTFVVDATHNRPKDFEEYNCFVEIYSDVLNLVDSTDGFYNIMAYNDFRATYYLPYGTYNVIRGGVINDTTGKFNMHPDIEEFELSDNNNDVTIKLSFDNLNHVTGEIDKDNIIDNSDYENAPQKDFSELIKVVGILMIVISVVIGFCLFFLFSMKKFNEKE